MSDLSPLCAPKQTSAEPSKFMGSQPSARQLELDLLGYIQSFVYVNSEISDGAFQLV
jgi:hypothetical protein